MERGVCFKGLYMLNFKVLAFLMILAPMLKWGHAYANRMFADGSVLVIPKDKKDKLSDKKSNFISMLYPHILDINNQILKDRARLLKLKESSFATKQISMADQTWLNQILTAYRFTNFKIDNVKLWTDLLKRVDIVPASLVLAQAASESAWGTSRFAKEGNNYFGQWCFTENCGLVPLKREPNKKHEVQKFASAYGSVKAYFDNLNTHRAYRSFRAIRAKLAQEGASFAGVKLAPGLHQYSSRGQAYVEEIQNLIKSNQLEKYASLSESA